MTGDQWASLDGLRAALGLGHEDADSAVEMGGAPLAAIQGLHLFVQDNARALESLRARLMKVRRVDRNREGGVNR